MKKELDRVDRAIKDAQELALNEVYIPKEIRTKPNNMKVNYVAGFMYSKDGEQVALIKKIKPDWQKGKLNGIGGKVELGESPYGAMVREFREETGAVHAYGWRCFCVLKGDFGKVYFYTLKGDLSKLKTMEEEEIVIRSVKDIPFLNTIPNLRWLVPMGIDQGNVGGIITEDCKEQLSPDFGKD